VIGVPLGVALTRRPAWRGPVLGLANVFQTIPSLALFGFLIPLPLIGGIGATTAVVALVVYALLLIVRNTYTGIAGVDPAVRAGGAGGAAIRGASAVNDARGASDTRAESPGSAPCAPCKGAPPAERALSGRGPRTTSTIALSLSLLPLILAGCARHDRVVVGS